MLQRILLKAIPYIIIFFLSSLSLYGENDFLFPVLKNKTDIFFTSPVINRGTYYTKPQIGNFFSVGAEVEIEDILFISLSAGWHYVFSTDYNFNFAFKGYLGIDASVEAGIYFWKTRIDDFELRIGISAEGSAQLSRYHSTFTYFFFPAAAGKAVFLITPLEGNSWFVRGAVPFVYHFRHDVSSIGTGLDISFGLY